MNAKDLLAGADWRTVEKKQQNEGRDDAHTKLPVFSTRLVLERLDQWAMLCGDIRSLRFNPSKGIKVGFYGDYAEAWDDDPAEGNWILWIEGHNLTDLYNHLCCARLEFFKIGSDENVTRVTVRENRAKKRQ